jgi:hypothetical protein
MLDKRATIHVTSKRTALYWVITLRVVVISYRRFGTTYRAHLQGSRIHDSWPTGPIGFIRTVGKKLLPFAT